jgi:fatty-acyl-CoA synthase
MPVAIREQFERVSGVRVLNSYGLTENTASVAIDPRDGIRKVGASGIRLPYTKIRAAQMETRATRSVSAHQVKSACCRSRDQEFPRRT